MHALLSQAASAAAARVWRAHGARTLEEQRAFMIAVFRRRMGVFAVREFARHRLRRVPYVGATRASVVARGRRGDAQLGGGMTTAGVSPADFAAHQALMRDHGRA